MMKNLMKYSLFLLNQEKTVKVKPNESYKPRERYQAYYSKLCKRWI